MLQSLAALDEHMRQGLGLEVAALDIQGILVASPLSTAQPAPFSSL
jgi:hypothetical protein